MIFYITVNSVLHSLMGNTKHMSGIQHPSVTKNSVTTLKFPVIYLFRYLTSNPYNHCFYYYYTFALPRISYSWNLTVHAYHFFALIHTIFLSLSYLPSKSSSNTTSLSIPFIFNFHSFLQFILTHMHTSTVFDIHLGFLTHFVTQICYCCCCLVTVLCLTFLQLHELQPADLLCPWEFPGKNSGVGCHFLLQGILLTQGSNPCILYRWVGSLSLSHHGSPKYVSSSTIF